LILSVNLMKYPALPDGQIKTATIFPTRLPSRN
jgi:hypothetical protein